ncbi:MAG TPA: MMPL family transporter [Rhizomicrobium sp.]|nr:MMPL family transporter [Rhizomicrobium sp.]
MWIIEQIVAYCCRHARVVVTAGFAAAILGFLYTATHFAMNTDSSTLISPDLPWRKTMARFDALFPQRNNLILVVIDGTTAERANAAADALMDKLAQNPRQFPAVRRPDGGPFFEKNGLLFLPETCVKDMMDKLVQAQPFLGALAADASLRGVMDSLSVALTGVAHGQAKLSEIDAPMTAFAATIEKTNAGDKAYLNWRELFASQGEECSFTRPRTFVEVQPALNYNALMPGADAEQAIRDTARQLKLTPENGVRVRLTGPVPLSDENFSSLADRADIMGIAMLLAVTFSLWLAVRSIRIIFCILVTLGTGLLVTTALGLLSVGVFNIISIAFIALFVGLGVDFAIQFSVRYRAERHAVGDLAKALTCAGRGVGVPLALAAAATAAGFFSFLPTAYLGVAELGLIAGIGMITAFVLAITLLPALIMLVKPPGEAERVGYAFFAPIDRFLVERRKRVIWWGAIAGVVSIVVLSVFRLLTFDFNPLDLSNPKSEALSTLNDLMKDPDTSPNTIDVLAPNLSAADKLAGRLSKQPLIGQVLTLTTFIPPDQDKKLAYIQDTAFLLDTTLNPIAVKAPPTDAETVASIKAAASGLRQAATMKAPRKLPAIEKKARADALRLARAFDALATGPKSLRTAASNALIPGLDTLLDELHNALQAGPVNVKTMPAELVAEWIAKDGTARVQVFPKYNANDNKSLKKFSKDVLSVTPDATGTPITIQESGQTIVRAFVEAGVWSFIAISILLALVLRRERDVIMTILPLVLTAILTLATCAVVGLQLNFANIIALPLLFGIGVAFNIYFVVAWRAGAKNLLTSSLTRAILFSALTTASGFGSLWISSHPGTASMGEMLIISLAWTLFTTLFFLPALLGPPPPKEDAPEVVRGQRTI